MFALKPLQFLLNAILISSVFTLGADKYVNDGAGFGYILPDYFYYFVMIGVLGMSLMWTVLHVLGGCFFGFAAGGVWDGLKMGFLLGLGLGLSRLWPYSLAWAGGIFAGNAPLLPIIGFLCLSGLLFALNQIVMYFWNNVHGGE